MRAIAILAVISVGGVAIAQNVPSGAKAIFFDTQTGRMVMPKVQRTTKQGAAQVPAITGLMYYLELALPGGELLRVNSSRVFHSGERFRVHVVSNVDGWLTVLQSQDGSRFEKLLPAPALPAASSHVQKGSDTVLPDSGSWFKFDEHPGEIRVLMLLSAEPAGGMPQIASAGDIAPERLRGMEQAQRGSKALLIETNDSTNDGYEVRLINSTRDNRLPPGQIVVEFRLQHRPRA